MINLKFIAFLCLFTSSIYGQEVQYRMPDENAMHEATWLQWPHQYSYGMGYRSSIDHTWVAMATSLAQSEKVFIVAYNTTEKNRIENLLMAEGVDMNQIEFFIHENDDVWVRDNGPIFVYDEANELTLLDWDFNGWGNDAPFQKCNAIPELISSEIDVPRIDLSAMVLEGGAVESDGRGTMMATRSSVTHASRNPNLTETEIEDYLRTYMGFTNFIWLDGLYGEDITDMHIDGCVKFANEEVILTMNQADLTYWGLSQSDIDLIYSAKNVDNVPFQIEYLPLTVNDVTTEYGTNLGYKGSYANYYIANSVILVPNYNDPNDVTANAIIQSHYPNRTVVGIDVRNLYENGGMIHCVTQQQPVRLNVNEIEQIESEISNDVLHPNPTKNNINLTVNSTEVHDITYEIVNQLGQIFETATVQLHDGKNTINITCNQLESGVYYLQLHNEKTNTIQKIIVERE